MKRCWCGNETLDEYSTDYYKCNNCNTLISKYDFKDEVYEVDNEAQDLYGKNYWEVSMTKAAGKNTLSEVVDMYLTERVIYWTKAILKYVKLGSRIAEVGCGLGQLEYVLKRMGYSQKAFELSPDICEYMEKQLGIDTHCGPFVPSANAYDGILAFDLFEHLMDPEEFMQYCSESLSEQGVLCFQTPCYDSELSYEEMMKQKPRFEEQLKAEQHIYLYSRDAITTILKKHGFTNIIFEPAFFGDDYDMFLFASKLPIVTNSDDEIDKYLNSVPNGRLLKAMITLFDKNKELSANYQVADNDRTLRWEQIQELEKLLQESKADGEARLEQIKELEKLLQVSKADGEARLEQIKELEKVLQVSKADGEARLEQIKELTRLLQESEADRAARLEAINELTRIINSSNDK